MKFHFSKYQGTGNDFIILDGKEHAVHLNQLQINRLCDRRFGIGADGIIILDNSETADFKMIYFNSDGNESTMCGNGGRCIVQFAKRNGYIANETSFEAIDGLHSASISNTDPQEVILRMNDVKEVEIQESFVFLNTGSPHYVTFVKNVREMDVVKVGRTIRNSNRFQNGGVNVNFAEIINDHLFLRTYERGVEDETLSCGTGVTAAVLAAVITSQVADTQSCNVVTPGGKLNVRYERKNNGFTNVNLIGPAIYVFEGDIEL